MFSAHGVPSFVELNAPCYGKKIRIGHRFVATYRTLSTYPIRSTTIGQFKYIALILANKSYPGKLRQEKNINVL